MNILFLGSPEPVIAPLEYLIDKGPRFGWKIVGVVTPPAKPVGRKLTLTDPPLASFAKEKGIKLIQTQNVNSQESLEILKALHIDVAITAAFGQILGKDFLNIAKRAVINIHPSRLPEYRGATPVQSALLDGCDSTAITILFTVKALDAGNIIVQKEAPIGNQEKSQGLMKRLFAESGDLLLQALGKLKDPLFTGIPQDQSKVTHCKKITKADGLIQWNESVKKIIAQWRAYDGWPGVYSYLMNKRVNFIELDIAKDLSGDFRNEIHKDLNLTQYESDKKPLIFGQVGYSKSEKAMVAQAKDGAILIKKLQWEGGKQIDAASFWNGLKNQGSKDKPLFFENPPLSPLPLSPATSKKITLSPTTMTKPVRIAVGISGSGRTLKNLLDYLAKNKSNTNFSVCGVFSSSQTCSGNQFAREQNIPLLIASFPKNSGESDPIFAKTRSSLYDWLNQHEIELVALGGFIRPFPIEPQWQGRIVNIHPSLLPKFGGRGMYGLRVHEAVLQANEQESGATVHYVTEHYDEGGICGQVKVPVLEGESAESLATRVFDAECILYPKILEELSRKIRASNTKN